MPISSNRLDDHALEQALDALFKKMEKMGVKVADETKEKIKKEMVSELHGSLSKSDLEDVNVQKKLMACITTFLLHNSSKPDANNLKFRPKFDALINSLKDDDIKKEPDKALDAKLVADLKLLCIMTKLIEETHKLDNSPKPTPANTKSVKKDNDPVYDQLETMIANLNGGVDTRTLGKIPAVIQVNYGDYFGTRNDVVPDPNSLSFKIEEVTFNAGKPDPMGLENISRINDLSSGEPILTKEQVASLGSPRPTPL